MSQLIRGGRVLWDFTALYIWVGGSSSRTVRVPMNVVLQERSGLYTQDPLNAWVFLAII